MTTIDNWTKTLVSILSSFKQVSIWAKDLDGNFIWMSEEMLKRHNYDLEEILGSNKTDATLRPADEAAIIRKRDLEVMATKIPKLGVAEKLTGFNNNPRWNLTNTFPLCNELGVVCGVCGFSIDITTRKRVEELLHGATVHVLHEACSDLEGIYRAIESILICEDLKPSAHKELTAIAESVYRTSFTTRANLEQIAAHDGLIIRPTKVDYRRHIMDPVIAMVAPLLKKHGTELDDALGLVNEGALTLMVDPLKLQLICKTLITNAVEAGATIVSYGYERKSDRVVLNYYDNGRGISEEAEKYLFTKDCGPQREKEHGTGMALHYAHKIIEHHGGKMYLKRTEKGETNIIIELPLFLN